MSKNSQETFQQILSLAESLGFTNVVWTIKNGHPLSFTFTNDEEHLGLVERTFCAMREGSLIDDVMVSSKPEPRN